MFLLFLYLIATFIISFAISLFSLPILIKKLKAANILGIDVHKPNKPQIPEMGGFSIIFSVIGSLIFAVALNTFFGFEFNLIQILTFMLTFSIIALIGIFDDLFDLRQSLKAFLPMVAALPLVAINFSSSTVMFIPFLGHIDFGIFYTIFLIPLGITVASNLTNMLAGFNGLEVGLGIIIFSTLSIISFSVGSIEASLISVSMLGALLVFFYFNKYPSKVFPGDIGTLSIGCAVACASIFGNFESFGALLLSLHIVDFFIKLLNGFPKSFGELKEDGKLYPPENKIKSLVHLIMKVFNGIKELDLVLILYLAQFLVAIFCLLLFFRVF